jgi:5-methylcytosine-specific restriction protein A
MGEVFQRPRAEPEERQAFTITFERDVLRRFVVCAQCGDRLRKRSDYQLDHEIPREIGGKHAVENVRPLCIDCHKAKTALDAKVIAKAKRLAGETCTGPSRRPLPKGAPLAGTKASGLKRRMDGTVVRRNSHGDV